jgi:hypothetical protein
MFLGPDRQAVYTIEIRREPIKAEWPKDWKILPRFLKSQNGQKIKVQNIYIKPILKPQNTYNKRLIDTVYLGENVKKIL